MTIQALRWLNIVAIGCALAIVKAVPMNDHSSSPLNLHSSDQQLCQAFDWAKKQALSYVRDRDPVGPWYEAALPGREAFCMRDLSHQAAGGQALGLSEHTYNMFHKFAENIAASRDWCTFWEIDRLNRPAPVDYESDQKFWYTLPASFDVLDACYRMFLWTGDRRYIDDPAMLNFYQHTMSDYIAKWDLSPEHIMDRHIVFEGARGIPSYVETVGGFNVGIDLLASQATAYRSYASILRARRDIQGADHYLGEARKVLQLIDSRWWNPTAKEFYGFYTTEQTFTMGIRWSLLYWDAISDPSKRELCIQHMADIPVDQDAYQVEDKSYYPEILYRHGFVEQAHRQILDLARKGRYRREYPEVSYALIGAMTRGMMGVTIDPAKSSTIQTLSGLSTETDWAELEGLSILGGTITVRHDGRKKSTLTNQGHRDVKWHAAFLGEFTNVLANGKEKPARQTVSSELGTLTSVDVVVKPGKSITVETVLN